MTVCFKANISSLNFQTYLWKYIFNCLFRYTANFYNSVHFRTSSDAAYNDGEAVEIKSIIENILNKARSDGEKVKLYLNYTFYDWFYSISTLMMLYKHT